MRAKWTVGAMLLFGVLSAACAAPRAHADTYDVYQVSHNSGNVNNVGLTDAGSLTVYNVSFFSHTTLAPPSTTTTSRTLPALTFDNGTSCVPSVSGLTDAGQEKCNGDYAVFNAYTAGARDRISTFWRVPLWN